MCQDCVGAALRSSVRSVLHSRLSTAGIAFRATAYVIFMDQLITDDGYFRFLDQASYGRFSIEMRCRGGKHAQLQDTTAAWERSMVQYMGIATYQYSSRSASSL